MNSREFIAEPYLQDKKKILSKKTKGGKASFNIISTNSFNQIKGNKNIIGFVKDKNNSFTNKEYGTLYFYQNDKKYRIDVYSKKPPLSSTCGYVKVGENDYIMVVKDMLALILLPVLLLLIIIGLITIFFLSKEDNKTIEPDNSLPEVKEKEKEEVDNGTDLNGEVILPEATTTITGTIKEPKQDHKDGSPYSGEVNVKVVLKINEVEHTLLESKANIKDGLLPELYIDYTKLDFELVPGVYYGTVYITYPDGTVEEYTICIIIRQSFGGIVEVNYSNEVKVDLNTKEINLSYKQGPSSSKTKLQVVLVKDNKEYILGESSSLNSGDLVETLSLNKDMTSILKTGEYSGLLRVLIENSDSTVANIKGDIEVKISVY